jgi:hypothetical protein
VELYDLASDPGESVNRVGDAPELLARMQGLLAQWRAEVGLASTEGSAPAARPEVAPEVAARLRALGYLD